MHYIYANILTTPLFHPPFPYNRGYEALLFPEVVADCVVDADVFFIILSVIVPITAMVLVIIVLGMSVSVGLKLVPLVYNGLEKPNDTIFKSPAIIAFGRDSFQSNLVPAIPE